MNPERTARGFTRQMEAEVPNAAARIENENFLLRGFHLEARRVSTVSEILAARRGDGASNSPESQSQPPGHLRQDALPPHGHSLPSDSDGRFLKSRHGW